MRTIKQLKYMNLFEHCFKQKNLFKYRKFRESLDLILKTFFWHDNSVVIISLKE